MQVGFLAGLIILVTIILAVIFVAFHRLGYTHRKERPKFIKAKGNLKNIQKQRVREQIHLKYGRVRVVKQKPLPKDGGMREDLGDQEDGFGPEFQNILESAWVTTTTPTYHELIEKALKELPIGKILFNPSEKMKVGDTELVEVRITQNITEDLRKGLEGRGKVKIKETEVSSYMKVCLTGSAFKIVPEISEPQIIESDKYTEWQFHVTPLKSGLQTLKLTYFVIISIADYGDRQKEYKVGEWEVNVKVNPRYFLKCYWRFIVGTLIAIVGLIIAIIAIM
jgi:hypothetical protein